MGEESRREEVSLTPPGNPFGPAASLPRYHLHSLPDFKKEIEPERELRASRRQLPPSGRGNKNKGKTKKNEKANGENNNDYQKTDEQMP